MRRALGVLVSLASLAAGVVLVVFAVDVVRWEQALAAQDVRFRGAPRVARFERPDSILPFNLAERTLGGSDDLVFRDQLEGFARIRPGAVFVYTERLHTLRGETQLGLASLSRSDPDVHRRSRAANMVGVLALDPAHAPRDPNELANLVAGAVGSFRNAVEIDPTNSDAKLNLEQVLRLPGAAPLPGDYPVGSPDAGRRAGIGRAGGGY
jgi:hypothetical protein